MGQFIETVCDEFHKLYEENRIWEKTSWLGVPIWKFPFDAFIIQELIFKIKPDYVIETGTNFGGSALFYASIMELINHGAVITVDIEEKLNLTGIAKELFSKRVISFNGDSIDIGLYSSIYEIVVGKKNMVILDSWHTKEHVLKELNLYSQLIPVGSYVIVEDSHVSGHPIKWKWGEGPYEAIEEFLKTTHAFAIDKSCEKLFITFNPNGFIKKVLHDRNS